MTFRHSTIPKWLQRNLLMVNANLYFLKLKEKEAALVVFACNVELTCSTTDEKNSLKDRQFSFHLIT